MAKKRIVKRKAKRTKAAKPSYVDESGKQRRGSSGRFLSKEQWEGYTKEIRRRLASKYEKANEQARQKEEAKRYYAKERKGKSKRTRGKNGKPRALYSNETRAEGRLTADSVSLALGSVPQSHDVRRVGNDYLHFWIWYGASAVSSVESFLINARAHFPVGTLGRIAIGTSYSKKKGEWVGTATLPISSKSQKKTLLHAYFLLLEKPSGQNVFGEDNDAEVWTEIELLLTEKTI